MKSFILPDDGTSISGNQASLNIVVHEVINFNHLTIQEKNKQNNSHSKVIDHNRVRHEIKIFNTKYNVTLICFTVWKSDLKPLISKYITKTPIISN